jgi:hypothetical protein
MRRREFPRRISEDYRLAFLRLKNSRVVCRDAATENHLRSHTRFHEQSGAVKRSVDGRMRNSFDRRSYLFSPS